MIVIKVIQENNLNIDRRYESESALFSHILNWQIVSPPSQWVPPTDLIETSASYIVRLEFAGADDSDFNIHLEHDLLKIHGKRQESITATAYYQMEIPFGEFDLTIHLPGQINLAAASATYQNGFLIISLPKNE